jgi:zinc/manganese transport system substrate-binding protein
VAGIAVVAAAVVLGACATDSQPGRAARTGPVIVASTDVYGAIAHAVAGDHAEITSIIDKAKGDPHDYEASTRDILAVSRADIVIENGGGYDDFMHTLRDAADNRDARVLDAVEITGRHANDDAVNEHVWYDLASMSLLAERLRDALAAVDPARAADYRANTAGFVGDVW